MGYSGVASGFLKHAMRQGAAHSAAHQLLLHRASLRKLIGGQEDQLIDIALEIKREQAGNYRSSADVGGKTGSPLRFGPTQPGRECICGGGQTLACLAISESVVAQPICRDTTMI